IHLLPAAAFCRAQARADQLVPPPSASRDAARALDVDLHDLAGLAGHEATAPRPRLGEELAQPVHMEAPQDAIRGPAREAGHRAEAVGSPAPLKARLQQRGLARGRGATRRSTRPGCPGALSPTAAARARDAPTKPPMKSTLDAGRSGADAIGDHDSASMKRMTAPETTPLPTAKT